MSPHPSITSYGGAYIADPNPRNTSHKIADECSFRQDSTLHSTWSRVGEQPLIPKTGQRKTVKVFGAVDITKDRFIYKTTESIDNPYGSLTSLHRQYQYKQTLETSPLSDPTPFQILNKISWPPCVGEIFSILYRSCTSLFCQKKPMLSYC